MCVCCACADETERVSGCASQQKAAEVMGFNQVTWDNLSGNEVQPDSWSNNYWSELKRSERAAAVILGYNQITWDNDSGSEPHAFSNNKHWSQLTSCGKVLLV